MSATETTETQSASPASVESASFPAAPRNGWIEHWTPENPDFWEATARTRLVRPFAPVSTLPGLACLARQPVRLRFRS